MSPYTVSELARLAGVSVRTLHHYDAIGILRPSFVAENGYRHYGREELLRLQHILILREMGLSLGEIGAMLDDPAFDYLSSLRAQRERVTAAATRFALMAETIDRTIAKLEGEREMKDDELYSGIVSPETQAEYERWLVARYGDGMTEQIADAHERQAVMSKSDREATMGELRAIETELAAAMALGIPPQAASLEPLLNRHRDWVATMWDRPCPPDAYAGLADMYRAHPDFVARYEAIATGFAEYLATAMKAWARRAR